MLNIMSIITNTLIQMQQVKLLKLKNANSAGLIDRTPESFTGAYKAIENILNGLPPTPLQSVDLLDFIDKTDGNVDSYDLQLIAEWLKTQHNVKCLNTLFK